MGIDKLKSRYDLEIRWRAFPLHPDTPEEELSLEDLFAGRDIQMPAVLERLKKVAGELGLPWGNRNKTCNSRRAQELGEWAERKGKGDAFRKAVFRAYFVEGKNIAEKEVLGDLASKVGLAKEEALEVLETRRFKAAVDADWRLSQEWGITAVPTFVINGERLVGAQPYEVLEEFVGTRRQRGRGSSPVSMRTGSPALRTCGFAGIVFFALLLGTGKAVAQTTSHMDVNRDGAVTSMDALLITNYVNRHGVMEVSRGAPSHFDVNRDGWVSPQDALVIINYLNQQGSGTQGGQGAPAGQGKLQTRTPTPQRAPAKPPQAPAK